MAPRRQVVVTLVPLSAAETIRRLTINAETDSVRVGRRSRTPAKGLTPDDGNAWIDNPVVSRDHAVIRRSRQGPEAVLIEDVGSLHGTWVNHRRLPAHATYPLATGDLLELGMDINRGQSMIAPLYSSLYDSVFAPWPSYEPSTKHAARPATFKPSSFRVGCVWRDSTRPLTRPISSYSVPEMSEESDVEEVVQDRAATQLDDEGSLSEVGEESLSADAATEMALQQVEASSDREDPSSASSIDEDPAEQPTTTTTPQAPIHQSTSVPDHDVASFFSHNTFSNHPPPLLPGSHSRFSPSGCLLEDSLFGDVKGNASIECPSPSNGYHLFPPSPPSPSPARPAMRHTPASPSPLTRHTRRAMDVIVDLSQAVDTHMGETPYHTAPAGPASSVPREQSTATERIPQMGASQQYPVQIDDSDSEAPEVHPVRKLFEVVVAETQAGNVVHDSHAADLPPPLSNYEHDIGHSDGEEHGDGMSEQDGEDSVEGARGAYDDSHDGNDNSEDANLQVTAEAERGVSVFADPLNHGQQDDYPWSGDDLSIPDHPAREATRTTQSITVAPVPTSCWRMRLSNLLVEDSQPALTAAIAHDGGVDENAHPSPMRAVSTQGKGRSPSPSDAAMPRSSSLAGHFNLEEEPFTHQRNDPHIASLMAAIAQKGPSSLTQASVASSRGDSSGMDTSMSAPASAPATGTATAMGALGDTVATPDAKSSGPRPSPVTGVNRSTPHDQSPSSASSGTPPITGYDLAMIRHLFGSPSPWRSHGVAIDDLEQAFPPDGNEPDSINRAGLPTSTTSPNKAALPTTLSPTSRKSLAGSKRKAGEQCDVTDEPPTDGTQYGRSAYTDTDYPDAQPRDRDGDIFMWQAPSVEVLDEDSLKSSVQGPARKRVKKTHDSRVLSHQAKDVAKAIGGAVVAGIGVFLTLAATCPDEIM